ncbi:MAG: hypothetical protein MK213_04975 [Planctomycetes bacterium]|nr:hypothetical protein [Planctomycetota bacterium]
MIRRPLLALITLIFLAFSSSIPNEWIWDDNDYVTENPVLTEPGGLGDIWTERDSIPQWYPLVHTTFWLEAHGPGRDAEGNLRPWVFHLTNVLLHIAGALFLLKLLVQLGFPSGAAWFLAALWAVHPVNVESVAWVTERKNVLSLLLALMSASYFLRWESAGQNRALVKCVVAFVGALLSKTVVASMPAVLMLLLWWRKRPLNLKIMLPLGAMLVVGGWMGLMTAMDEVAFVGAEGAKWDHSWAERSLIAGRAVWFYAGKALLPYPLLFVYERWDIQVEDWVQWLYPAAALLLLTVALVGIRRWGRGPLAALLVFGGVLFPALGFLDVFPHQYSFVADHFQYHALPALVVLLGALFLRIFPLGETWKSWLPHATLLLALGVVSHVQSHLYENEKCFGRMFPNATRRRPSPGTTLRSLSKRKGMGAWRGSIYASRLVPGMTMSRR